MSTDVLGIHHVTAIAADPRENLAFYREVLGMRLVKRSVNQDDPGTYHLFYADADGHPGTDLTFFPWPHLPPARQGTGLTNEVALAVPRDTIAFWQDRLSRAGVAIGTVETRFGDPALPFRDPHGLHLALVETSDTQTFTAWERSPVPAVRQVRGFHSVRLWERDLGPTAGLLQQVFGWVEAGEEAGWHRFGPPGGGSGTLVEVREDPTGAQGQMGRGAVHHVAFRVRDDATQRVARERVAAASLRPTPVIDRFWFRSVYFLEPGGALFELATDGPGFAVDEDPAHLGEHLVLPPWLEPQRAQIEAALPALPTETG
jgi:glyoxalase family protein